MHDGRRKARALSINARQLWASGKPSEAISAFREAARLDPDDADAHFNLGVAQFRRGELAEAAMSLERTLDLRPGFSKALRPLAHALEHLGRERAAGAAYRRLSRVADDPIERRLCMVKALILEGSFEEAEKEARRVVAFAPAHAGARSVLGDLLLEKGRFEEAQTHLIQAFDAYPSVFQRLASSKKMTEVDRPLVERAKRMVERPDIDPVQRGTLHFGLGKALDDLGDVAAAMRHYEMGNEEKALSARMNRAGWSARYSEIISVYSAEALRTIELAEPSVQSPEDELPILIVGMPRSGTTLVEQILSSHPQVVAGGELSFWFDQAMDRTEPAAAGAESALKLPVGEPNRRLGGPGQHAPEAPRPEGWTPYRLALPTFASLSRAAESYKSLLRTIGPYALRVADKAPFNFERLGLLLLAVPYARIIHCRRNPVDTCLSMFFTSYRGRVAWSRADLVFQYREYERLMEHWRRILPNDRFNEVQYEALIADQEAETRRLISFCGLEWNDACLAPERNDRPVRTASAWQARQPVYKSSVERWRRYEPWLGELRELLPEAERSADAKPARNTRVNITVT